MPSTQAATRDEARMEVDVKLSDRERVEGLLRVRDRTVNALEDAREFYRSQTERKPGTCLDTPEGLPGGFWCSVNTHSDGSGPGVDLTGVYVGVKMAAVTLDVLEDHLETVDNLLRQLGVDVDA